ncbi:energy transducer TonB [Sphingopyxis sp. PET50]|uniref:energy transducer TonB n=1 Tax=Sphingopyxis sp. PET50 TaxID=2976533 RepID=UPI0021B026D4|nr:energy transducer TonB [Sphingopyxis sp. PET50]
MDSFSFKPFVLPALLLCQAPAHAADSPVLAPATPWKVDYAKEECRLLRTFGTGENAVTMRLARGSGVQSFDMVIAGTKVPRLGDEVKVTMKLEPQGTLAEFDGYSMGVPNRPEKFIRWYDGSPEILAGITDDQQVRLLADKKLDVVMRWSDGKAALAALQTCHDDLLKSWGANIAEIRALKVQPQPIGSPGRWATNADYPMREMHREIQGTVTFQLKLDATGAVENCLILLSSDSAVLDEQSCKLMRQRAKFKPARDANDKPVTSFYVNRIRWQIPK